MAVSFEQVKDVVNKLDVGDIVYLMEQTSSYADDVPLNMDEFNSICEGLEPSEIAEKMYHGLRYGSKESFCPHDEYISFDGYANFVSIPDSQLDKYVDTFRHDVAKMVYDDPDSFDLPDELEELFANDEGVDE